MTAQVESLAQYKQRCSAHSAHTQARLRSLSEDFEQTMVWLTAASNDDQFDQALAWTMVQDAIGCINDMVKLIAR